MIETSEALEKIFYQYTHLPIGGKEINCPYWMNSLKKKIIGPFGGKGKPVQIILATEEKAKNAGLNLAGMNKESIIGFMKEERIGVDCSGFVFWLLNALDIEKGGNGICDDIPHCQGKFFCRANVLMLTNEEVSIPINELNKVQVGDMIRLGAGKHIAIVVKILREDGVMKDIEYAHSSALTSVSGVHSDRIIVENEDLKLEDQIWLEKTAKGNNYKTKYFPGKGDGIKRLKIWS